MELYSQQFVLFLTLKWVYSSSKAFPDQSNVTLQLIVPIPNLQRKWSVVNMAPGAVFTTVCFIPNFKMGPISSSQVFLDQSNVTLQLIVPIHKLQSCEFFGKLLNVSSAVRFEPSTLRLAVQCRISCATAADRKVQSYRKEKSRFKR